tara:strand:+ start:202 stop:468 length:267 start_codon:yes stop_codon:yes gene_type:complete
MNEKIKYLSSWKLYVLLILSNPRIKKILNEDNIKSIEIIILSNSLRIKFDVVKPPVEIIVKDRLNLSSILKSVKFKKKIEIKKITVKA